MYSEGGREWFGREDYSDTRLVSNLVTTGAKTIFQRGDFGQNQASSAITQWDQWDLLLFKQQNVGMITHHSNVLLGGGNIHKCIHNITVQKPA